MIYEVQPVAKTYAGLAVVILGMARQGTALARFFLAHGARVTLSDLRSADQLRVAQDELLRFAAEHDVPPPRFVLRASL